MYSVSDEFKKAMKKPVLKTYLKGTIGDVNFNDSNILSGSFSITNQCSGSEALEIGQVYVGELNATFLNINLERYKWKGQVITPFFGLELADKTVEYIPLGVFIIDSAEWTKTGVVVKAYDNMSLLDKNCNKTITEVTAYECLQRIEKETGIVFANSEEEIKAFPNGDILISETTSNDVETWRDLLSWLSQTLCAFAASDREGKIKLTQYKEEVDDTIDNSLRLTGASFSDFITRYTGLSVVNMADSTTNYYGLDIDDGLTMNLGSNPFLQYGLDQTKEDMRKSILNGLQAINYVPFKVKTILPPVYDLGDVLVFSKGLADESKKYCISKFTFNYHGTYELQGVGKDPSLSSAKSKTDKNISGLISNTDENTLVNYSYSNSKAIDIKENKQETIASIRFASGTKDSEVSFKAELLLNATSTYSHSVNDTVIDDVTVSTPPLVTELQKEVEASDKAINELNSRIKSLESLVKLPDKIKVKVSYMLNGTELDYHPKETYGVDGDHLLSLHYYIGNIKANTIYIFTILLEVVGATIHFDSDCINAFITGMGLAGTGKWDGTLTAEDEFTGISYKDLVGSMSDKASVDFVERNDVSGFSDSFGFSFASILGEINDEISIGTVVCYYILSSSEGKPTFNKDYLIVNTNNAFVLETNYSLTSKSSSVDEGYLEVLDVYETYSDLKVIESMVVK